MLQREPRPDQDDRAVNVPGDMNAGPAPTPGPRDGMQDACSTGWNLERRHSHDVRDRRKHGPPIRDAEIHGNPRLVHL